MYSQKEISRTIFHNQVKIKTSNCSLKSEQSTREFSNLNIQLCFQISSLKKSRLKWSHGTAVYLDHSFSGTHYSTQLQANTLAFW